MKYYIGLDLGTSAVKAVVFDELGNIINSYSEEYDIISLNPGWAEEDPFIWYRASLKTLRKIGESEYSNDIKAMSFSGQMHGLVLLDENNKILRNSIIWCDNRTSKEALKIEKTIGLEKLKEITGNISMPAFTLAKLLWVKDNEPLIYSKIAKVMLPKDYIRYMLTGVFDADYSDASGMNILDIKNKCYSKEILDAFDIPLSIFGKLKNSTDISAKLSKEIALMLGLPEINVIVGGGDQAIGAIGSGVIKSNDLSIVLGSSGVVYTPLNDLYIAPNGEVQTFITANNKYHIMGVTNGCGTSFKWVRDKLFNENYSEMTEASRQISCGADGLIFLPYLMGERTPILDSDASGIFFGIRNTTTKGHIIRAVLEGVGYSIKDCYNLIPDKKDKIYISGGGANSLLWRQIIASMINKPVIRISSTEAPALGAAICAMVGDGLYQTLDEAIEKIIKPYDITNPIDSWTKYYENGYKLYKKLYNDNKENYKIMRELQNEIF